MGSLTKTIVQALARLYLRRFQPKIIGVTGNVGKTSTKEMIGHVLGTAMSVRVAAGNLNNEIGLPFNIISGSSDEYYEQGGNLWFGIKTFFRAVFGLFGSNYPEVLVLEYGADYPGDIKKLTAIVQPDIAVVTAVGDVPVHVEFFKNADAVADEKSYLVKALPASGCAVLNVDDSRVWAMREKTKARRWGYGFAEAATVRASDSEIRMQEDGKPLGVSFKLHYDSSFVPVIMHGSLGRSQAYSAAAAASVGIILGMNLVAVSQALATYEGPKGRLKIISGINGSTIIDDTYNASPASTRLALETLRDLPGLHKIAVLGNMLELGQFSEKAHREIGVLASQCADTLICVGDKAKDIAHAAREAGLAHVHHFENSIAARDSVRDLIKEHDIVLVKGSQGARMEKIVAAILADPAQASELLVRQSVKWLSK